MAWEKETKEKLAEYSKNIGKRGKIIDSPIAGNKGQEGTIIGVIGKLPDGFRYEFKMDKPNTIFKKDTFYPPVFLVEILDEN